MSNRAAEDEYIKRILEKDYILVSDSSISISSTNEEVNKSRRFKEKSTFNRLRLCWIWYYSYSEDDSEDAVV